MRTFALLGVLGALAACPASAPAPAAPTPTEPAPADAPPVIDAAPDAPPDISTRTDAYRFRFASASRTETWTLWFDAGAAIVTVQPATGTLVTYQGTATEGTTLAIAVQTSSAKIALDCKRATREIDPACSAPRAKKVTRTKVDALDCYVAGFAEPMPFAKLPGIEYSADGACVGYHALEAVEPKR